MIRIKWICALYWFCEAYRRVTTIQYDVPCFIDAQQVQFFIDHFSTHEIKEIVSAEDGENFVVTAYKPVQSINLHVDPDVANNDLGSSGIWKSELNSDILIGSGRTAHLGGGLVKSDPWVSMIDDHGEVPEEDREPVIKGKWTREREDSFQSVASSNKERIQIRDLKTGADIVLTRAEVIAKFRIDRYNDEHGFDVNMNEE